MPAVRPRPATSDPTDLVSLTVTVETEPSLQHDVVLSAVAAASMGSVLAELRRQVSVAGPLLLDGSPLPLDGSWLAAGLRHGSVLRAHETEPEPVAGPLQLRVVCGPSAGLLTSLPVGGATLGRRGCTLTLDDAEVSRGHVQVSYGVDGSVTARDLGSTNGLAVDGRVVAGAAAGLVPGAVLSLGESRVQVGEPRCDAAAVVDDGLGHLVLNRPPRRRLPAAPPLHLTLPVEPRTPDRTRVPLTALVVPLLLGAVLFLTMPSSPQYLLLMAMSPLMVAGNAVADRRGGRRRHRNAVAEHAAATREVERRVDEACRSERQGRLDVAPDPAELAEWALLPSSRLWERRPSDPDAWHVRLGLADQPAAVRLSAPGLPDRPSPLLREVPVGLDLDETQVLGVAGPVGSVEGLVRWLVLQSTTLHGPEDVQVMVLSTAVRLGRWEWLRWLPHSRDPSTGRVLVAADEASYDDLLGRLLRGPVAGRGDNVGPRVLLVVDGSYELRGVRGLSELLARAGELRLHVVCADREERLLPQQCRALASFAEGSSTRLTLRDAEGHETSDVLADQVGHARADEVARGLGRFARAVAGEGGLPSSGRLLDLLRLAVPKPEDVAAGWSLGGRSTRAVLGWGPEGEQVVDLAEDGPHALVAGTTGAGKSELLQTLVASLAVANRPDALQFVLVDYKGGAAFRDCARLPHTVGLVTDLDGRLTERALASLTAELRTREAVLAEHGVKDLEQLWAQQGTGSPVLARLVIVIDEFATLVEELPEFVRGLVGIAQRGRSLGIHLVLATQRPGGVVSPDIRANTNLRICLRVTHAAESSDVVDSAASADIPAALPGRAHLRSGDGSLTAFQAARVGGRWRGPQAAAGVPRAQLADFASVAGTPAVASGPAHNEDDGPSDLAVLVEALRGANDLLGLGPARRPWLDPLPAVIGLAELVGPADASSPSEPANRSGLGATPDGNPWLTLGLLDLPAGQEQLPYQRPLATTGHLLVVGAPRSGRTCALQTAVASAVSTSTPDDLHVYALDFGNGGLAPLAELPHCGAVVLRDEADRLERLLARLQAEVERRQQVLAAGGFADLAEQRQHAGAAERLPWMLLLVDRWEGFLQAYQDIDMGRRVDELLRLLREGLAVGLRAVVTADRGGLLGRLPSVMPEKLLLRLADRADYALADVPARDVPASAPPGRALMLGSGASRSFHELQMALLSGDPDGRAQHQALRAIIAEVTRRHPADTRGTRPIRVDGLPATVTVDETLALGPVASEASGDWALVGVGGDELHPVGVDLADEGPALLIAGLPRSGRTTALSVMTQSLLRAGRPVCLVAPPSSPLRQLAGVPGVVGCLGADTAQDEAAALLAGERLVVAVDDAERFTDTAVGAVLEAFLRTRNDLYVLAAGNSEDLQSTYRGFTLEVRRSRCGLLLNPASTLDGDLVGVRLPRTSSPTRLPGRGLLVVRGELTPVQVALPAPAPVPAPATSGPSHQH